MNHEQTPPQGGVERFMRDLSLGAQRRVRQEIEEAQSKMRREQITAQGRAVLTYHALEHVGALTAMETHLNQVAPGGAARYREIVDSYTIAAASQIRRWQG